jgi:hypothetical protein
MIMAADEKKVFEKLVLNSSKYFEFGCGGSTFFVTNHDNIKKVVSVDSSLEWINNVKQQINSPKLKIVHIDFEYGDWGCPTNPEQKNIWETYSSSIDSYKDEYDLIFVDGRFRVACAIKAYNHLSENGLVLVHDYRDRPHYHILEQIYEKVDQVRWLVCFRKKQVEPNILEELWQKYKHDPN